MVTCEKGYVKVGDTVAYRPNFGRDAPIKAVVEGLQLTATARSTSGHEIESVPSTFVEQNQVLFILKNVVPLGGVRGEAWAYSEQIVEIIEG